MVEWRINTGAVHQDIDRAEVGVERREKVLDFPRFADIALGDERPPGKRVDIASRPLGAFAISEVGDRDICAARRQPHGDGAADAAVSTGHQCEFAVESKLHHIPPNHSKRPARLG